MYQFLKIFKSLRDNVRHEKNEIKRRIFPLVVLFRFVFFRKSYIRQVKNSMRISGSYMLTYLPMLHAVIIIRYCQYILAVHVKATKLEFGII